MKKLLTVLLIALGLASACAVLAYQWANQRLNQPLAQDVEHYVLDIQSGDNAGQIIARVSQHFGRQQQRLDYRLAQWFIGIDRIQAGVYQVSADDSWRDLWQMIKKGQEKTFSVTLIEGQTFKQWSSTLADADYLDGNLPADPVAAAEQLNFIAGVDSVEGLFLPETYHYRAHETSSDILRRAYHSMQQMVNEIWQQRSADCPVSTPYELLILASIIEKETGLNGERTKVASVFANRLATGMRLQSDPTTIYGVVDFDGNLTRQHLRQKTPYNTYRINGLPPTPIAMPSIAALRAAANPADTDYFYFVANDNGEHVFSKTLEAHNRAVQKYQIKN